jgi:predicted O-methyltransferase YrrM
MPPEEGDALYDAAVAAGAALPGLPFLEVGSYCGRSTVWLGGAARECGTVLFAVDHHRGSEGAGRVEHHDTSIVDPRRQMDTCRAMTRPDAGLEDVVSPSSAVGAVAAHWNSPCAFVFIDGGHGEEPARDDYLGWTPKVAMGGTLAIHDVFPDPADGGRPPYEQIFRPAVESGRFRLVSATGSLRVLQRVD